MSPILFHLKGPVISLIIASSHGRSFGVFKSICADILSKSDLTVLTRSSNSRAETRKAPCEKIATVHFKSPKVATSTKF